MDQRKIGEFLKQLRKSEGFTQEQLGEHFYVSSRTVSRWETGSNLPDISTLIKLSEFYNVDIREIIDGERKSEEMENEIKDTLKKVSEYSTRNAEIKRLKALAGLIIITMIFITVNFLFGGECKGILNGIVPSNICSNITWVALGTVLASNIVYILICINIRKQKKSR